MKKAVKTFGLKIMIFALFGGAAVFGNDVDSGNIKDILAAIDFGNTKEIAVEDVAENKSVDLGVQDKAKEFYEDYLAKYYPKALVIRSNFLDNKDPKSIAGTLHAFINLLAEQPWFYVADKPDGFKMANYWEYIIDQCALVNDYLKKAYVDLEKNTVYVPTESLYYDFSYFGKAKPKAKQLIEFLKDSHNDVLGEFYAFSFDFVIKLFNEGILVKDFSKALKYKVELEFIMSKLQNTSYESEYQEFLIIAKRIFELLKKKRNGDEKALLDCIYGDDEKGKKKAQEMMALNGQG